MKIMLHSTFIFLLISIEILCQSQKQKIHSNINYQVQKALEQTKNSQDDITMINSKMNNYKNQVVNDFQAYQNQLQKLAYQTNLRTEQIKKYDQQIKSWTKWIQQLNRMIKTATSYIDGINQKLANIMSKIIGFEQTLKSIISLDTLVVCILSLVLIKILKDQFVDEGYRPLSNSNPVPNSPITAQNRNAQLNQSQISNQ